jgi:hypothetical protein
MMKDRSREGDLISSIKKKEAEKGRRVFEWFGGNSSREFEFLEWIEREGDINNVSVIFEYPEIMVFPPKLEEFIRACIVWLKKGVYIYILTVSEWIVYYVNFYMRIGALTDEQREILEGKRKKGYKEYWLNPVDVRYYIVEGEKITEVSRVYGGVEFSEDCILEYLDALTVEHIAVDHIMDKDLNG